MIGANPLLEPKLRRTGDDERNVGRTFVRLAFPEEAVVTEHFTVIGGEDYQPGPMCPLATRFESGNQRNNLMIELFDQPEVSALRSAQCFTLEPDSMPLRIP